MQRIATIGMFDGVHRGHRYLLDQLKEKAREIGLRPTVVTFPRHPLAVIRPDAAPRLLTSEDEKNALLANEGVEVIVLPFDDAMRRTPAREFMLRLKEQYGVAALMLGFNNRFGSDRLGFEECCKAACELGLGVFAAQECPAETAVSSSAVRRALEAGDVALAASLLGRPYTLAGTVEGGDHIGRTIGFPTANLATGDTGKLVPRSGVYGCTATIDDGSEYRAVVNIGSRPTVNTGSEERIEAFLIGFGGDLYGRTLTLWFEKRLRDEKRFPDLDALRHQIETDLKNYETGC